MEEDFETSSAAKTYLPLAVGIAGVIFGIAALAFAINSASRASSLEKSLKSLNESAEASAKTAQELKSINDKLMSAFEQIESIRAAGTINVNAVSKQVQNAINTLSSEISDNRSLIAKNQEAISELATRGARPSRQAAARTAPAVQSDSSTAAEAPKSQGGRIHKVKQGESFSVIAKKYGVKISDIERANPNIDSRRLSIGQEIVIP
ncbi:MAG: LysM peptidoglycan-binding domain-containing protein [Opitutales bacterium]|nr:LysM peptidoglycan-binding domain-containing protein [Opitutales bacterium]